MSNVDTRQVKRDSLFLLAEVRVDGGDQVFRVKVRNLSAGGMMAETADARVLRGTPVTVVLRNIGEVEGSIAWIQGERFGIAFAEEIDPQLARATMEANTGNSDTPRFVRPVGVAKDDSRIRKI
ncbi:PilZ domain-containing protein [Paraurantiacibacter namhicola]|uniref:PilZ domain protein n=1 Tax=Paraurantiacibacter namhicola TaxID=645517 RepID=A0A1C7D546_9SPHN|nr:PilZ domain-containing protein [Paraurantiacibacter namhicola]ANU06574.1 PilZ domain protein [Paraurantiacibacter namhicola]